MTVFCQLSVLYSTVTRDVDIFVLSFFTLYIIIVVYICMCCKAYNKYCSIRNMASYLLWKRFPLQHTALDTAVALFCHCLVCDVVNCTILNTTNWKLLHDKDQYDSVTDREIHVDMVARFDG